MYRISALKRSYIFFYFWTVGTLILLCYYSQLFLVNLQLLFIANLKHKYIKEDQKRSKVKEILPYPCNIYYSTARETDCHLPHLVQFWTLDNLQLWNTKGNQTIWTITLSLFSILSKRGRLILHHIYLKVNATPDQLQFYGFYPWIIIQRVTLPICVFFRF